jgi:hypothetical protein
LLPWDGVVASTKKITAESGRNDFNIAASSKADVGNRHLFEMMDFWHEL